MKFLFLAMLLATTAHAAEGGHSVGNGGGVICIAGKCSTLVEAGLRMAPEFDGVWIPKDRHFSLVQQMLDLSAKVFANTRKDIYFSVFGRGDHFRRVEVVDPGRLEAIRRQYIEVAQKAGFTIDPATFQLVAFSSDETVRPALTYLLPGFFSLSDQQQSQILIHEGLYRGKPSSFLKYVLQFESAMAETSKYPDHCKGGRTYLVTRPCVDQQILMYRLGYLNRAQLFAALIGTVMQGGEFDSDLIGDFSADYRIDTGYLVMDPRKILDLGSEEPRLPYIFSKLEKLNFKLKGTKYGRISSPKGQVNWNEKTPHLSIFVPRFTDKDTTEEWVLQDNDAVNLVLPE